MMGVRGMWVERRMADQWGAAIRFSHRLKTRVQGNPGEFAVFCSVFDGVEHRGIRPIRGENRRVGRHAPIAISRIGGAFSMILTDHSSASARDSRVR